MSKTVDRALEAVKNTQFEFVGEREIKVLNAFIFWTNFEGRVNKFGNKARTFNLAVTAEAAQILNEKGWRVKDLDNGEGEKLYFVNIKVNMQSYIPPIVTIHTEYRGKRSRRSLDIDTIGELDRVHIEQADLVIREYESKNFPGKVSGYLKKLYIIQEPDIEFGGKYDDWMEEEDPYDDISDE